MVERPGRWTLTYYALVFAGAALVPAPADAVLPLPVYPQCGAVPDTPSECPADMNENWRYLSYVKDEYKRNVRREEWSMGTGIWLDRAFSLETGDPRVTIAVLDSGIKWDNPDLLNKHRLNTKELPLPQRSTGQTASSYDLNSDGLVNIQDYAQDPRVRLDAGVDVADDLLDPSDLITTFSDSIDQDGNGYTDDISGWDFFWDDNNPYDSPRYGHGTSEGRWSAAEGDNGDEIGTCPNCMILSLRIADSFIGDISPFAEAVVYAADNGAQVIQEAMGTVDNSSLAIDALRYANSKGATVVASMADETSIHQNLPANNEGMLRVHGISYDGQDEASSESFLNYENCTNFGGNLHLSVSGTDCSSEATGRSAGVVGLLYSSAVRRGLTLTSNEVRQLLTQNADDIDLEETYDDGVKKWYPSQPGWDRYYGYGRLNAYRAVQAVQQGRIPPEAEIDSPRWFEVLSPSRTPVITLEGVVAANRSSAFSYTVEYAVGLDPLDSEFVVLKSATNQTKPVKGALASFDLTKIPREQLDPSARIAPLLVDDTNVERHEKVNRYTVTVRVRVVDAAGNRGEARKTLYVHEDPDLLPAFPVYVAASLESSPRLFDLDGDGRDELIQATNDGTVHAFRADGSELPGWPVSTNRLKTLDPRNTKNHLGAPAFRSGAVSAARGQTMIASPAIGDLDADGEAEVVAATLDGEVYAWHVDGTMMAGFPATIDYSKATDDATGPGEYLEAGFFGSPALADLDGDGRLEIVIGGMDQWVYAFDHRGGYLPGWPVHVRYTGAESEVAPDRITTSPAVGDVNGDGRIDVVIGTNEIIDSNKSPTYAIHGDGNAHAGGPFLSGWPVLSQGIYADVLPVVGKGMTNSPVLADLDGDGRLEVATHIVTATPSRKYPSIFRFDGRGYSRLDYTRKDWGPYTNTDEPMAVPVIGTGAFGDIDQDGDLDYALSLGGFNALANLMVNARRIEHNYLIGAWDATTGKVLAGFPQQVPDMQFFMNPAIVDVDGDGLPEVVSGNGAFTVDAFNRLGAAPAGWPKFTGQWNIAAPAVGDMDGDGLLELVQSTRSGWIYVWHTAGATLERGGVVEWASWRHDPRNTGNFQTPVDTLAGPAWHRPSSLEGGTTATFGCSSSGTGGETSSLAALGLLAVALLRARRRG